MKSSASKYGKTGRRNVVLFLLALCSMALVLRLFHLQVVVSKYLQEQGNLRSLRVQKQNALRGMIMDREGEPLAISSPVSSIVVDPKILLETLKGKYIAKQEKCLDKQTYENCAGLGSMDLDESLRIALYQKEALVPLATLLERSNDDLFQELQEKSTRRFLYLKRNIQPALMDDIMALKLPAISREDGFQRFYPDGELTGQIIGFTGLNEHGQEGIERQYDSWLSGTEGRIRVMQDLAHNPISILGEDIPTTPGQALQLSIDKRLQFVMRKVLLDTMNEFKAESVSGVMIDIKTGEILSMVSLPDGNPNNPAERIPQLMKNKVITDVFEPGSTIKPIAVAAALEAGAITEKTSFPTNKEYYMGRYVVRDTHNYGTLDTIGVIRKSSNIGMAMISQRVPRNAYYAFMQNMGFGQRSGIKFPGEQRGVLQNPDKLGDFSYATTFFGYGISTTALQIAHAYATLANDGVKVPITLIKRERPEGGIRVMNSKVAKSVMEMMRVAVLAGGTGKRANAISYTVAGKTGTAHKVIHGEYDKTRYRGLFAGVAPATNPRVAVAIVVEDPAPGGEYYGGIIAAPAFARIVEWSLRIMGVLPDKVDKAHKVNLSVEPELLSEDNDFIGAPIR